jgi:hypothetical protein
MRSARAWPPRTLSAPPPACPRSWPRPATPPPARPQRRTTPREWAHPAYRAAPPPATAPRQRVLLTWTRRAAQRGCTPRPARRSRWARACAWPTSCDRWGKGRAMRAARMLMGRSCCACAALVLWVLGPARHGLHVGPRLASFIWPAYGWTSGVCVCVSACACAAAASARQVEVQCGERGRALSACWNAFVAAHADSVEALTRRLAAQRSEIREVGRPVGRVGHVGLVGAGRPVGRVGRVKGVLGLGTGLGG